MEGFLMAKKYEVCGDYRVIFETPDDGYSYFFGYYDKSPLNQTNDKLLAHRIPFDGRNVNDGDVATVGFFDLKSGNFYCLGETLAWNWQQGSQLQWLPPSYSQKCIYNDIENNQFVSHIVDIDNNCKVTIPFPIYAVHPSGKEAIAINYERLYWCRPGYNYQNVKNKKWDVPFHSDDGIFKVSLTDGTVKKILSIEDIVNNKPLSEFSSCNNWLEHIMYSPTGCRIMFFHRWHSNGVDNTRCYTANSDGTEIFLYPDSKFYSHACWKSDDVFTIWTLPFDTVNKKSTSFVAWVKKIKIVNSFARNLYSLLKPFLSKNTVNALTPKSSLYDVEVMTNNFKQINNASLLPSNGHNSWDKQKNKILIDSYEDSSGYRSLLIHDESKGQVDKIGVFFSEYNACGFRSDLHPRFSLDDRFIVIDSAHELKRKILIIKKSD